MARDDRTDNLGFSKPERIDDVGPRSTKAGSGNAQRVSTEGSEAADTASTGRSCGSCVVSRIPGGVFTVVAAGVLVIAVLRLVTGGGSPAPTPTGFTEGTAPAALISADGRPVLAVVSADWCGPCQRFKRETLADKDVTAALEGVVERIIVDADAQPELAAKLEARHIPLSVLLRDGEVVARRTGFMGEADLLGWLRAHGVELATADSSGP